MVDEGSTVCLCLEEGHVLLEFRRSSGGDPTICQK